jgi:TonB family protein
MTYRRNPSDADISAALPPELLELDRELSAIRIEERPSFGPELEGELLAEWQRAPTISGRTLRPGRRVLIAACMALLMVGGLAVPSARGSVARLVRAVLEEAAPSLFTEAPEPELPEIVVVDPPDVPPSSEATARTEVSPPVLDLEEQPLVAPSNTLPNVEFSYPEIIFREEAETLIASYYPVALQRAGVGGAVRLMLWVDADGRVDNVQMREGSGYRSLNLAAMIAARELQFRPATRAGRAVGTYVEFTVSFVPPEAAGVFDLDGSPPEGPTG